MDHVLFFTFFFVFSAVWQVVPEIAYGNISDYDASNIQFNVGKQMDLINIFSSICLPTLN